MQVPYLKSMHTRIAFIILFGCMAFSAPAQTWQLPFSGKVDEFDEKKQKDVALEGAVITLYKGSSLLSQMITPSNGKFKFSLDGNADYTVTVTKAGYITKKFAINTGGVSDERGGFGFGGFDIGVGLFRTYPGLDYSCLGAPIAKISYNSAKDVEDFDYDREYTAKIQQCIEQLKELERQARLKERQYNEAMDRANKAFGNKQYEPAKLAYQEALNIKANDQPAMDGIKKCEEALALLGKATALENEYKNAMARGTTAMGAKNYDDAITAFNDALRVKANDPTAMAKLKEATDAKNLAAANAAKEASYKAAMDKANGLFGQAKYEDAKSAYKEALGHKPGDQPATDGVNKCDAELKKIADKDKIEADYKAAMDKANGLFGQQKFTEAKTSYQAALGYKPGDQPATDGVNKCDAELRKIADKDKLEADYKAAMDKGNGLFGQQKFTEAKTSYQAALGYKPGDQPATDGVNKCDAELKKIADKEKLEADYKAAMTKANASFGAKKYEEAKASYQAALGFKSGDQPATDGIAKCDAELAKIADAKGKEAAYQAAMTKANGLFGEKKYEDAKASFQEALNIKSGDQPATSGIAKCDAELLKIANAAEAQKKYDAAMARGNGAMGEKKFDDAITAFNEALGAKPKDEAATAKLKEATDARNALMSAAAKEKAYNEAMEKAKTAFAAQDYAGAKVSYQAALGIKSGDQPATDGIAKCDDELAKIAAAAAKEKAYNDAMTKAKAAFGLKKYEDAKTNYQAALDAKPGDQPATDGIAKCDEELAKIADAKGKEAAYQAAMTKANGLFGEKKFEQAKAAYQEALNIKSGDQPATSGIAKCDAELLKIANAAEAQKKYDAAMTRGNAALGEKKYDDAITAFNEALGAKPKDETATAKLKEATDARNALMSAAAKEKAYNEAMEKAKSAFDRKEYASAKTSYQAALSIKSGDQPATDGIAKCDDELAKIAAATAKEKAYNDAMTKAKAAFGLKKYEDAKTNYQAALDAKPGDQPATDGIAKCDDELAKIAGNKEKEAAYQAAMTKANGLFGEKKFEDAKASYQEALNIKSGDQPATSGIAKCDAELLKIANAAEAQKKYDAAMTRGNAAMGEKKYDDAIAAFNEALGVKAKDPAATAKLKEATDARNALMSAAAKEKAYNEAMAKAKTAFDAQDYAGAKISYQAALGLKAGDQPATDGIAKCDTALKNKTYADAMAKADGLLGEKKYTEAKTQYEAALAVKPSDDLATAGVKKCNDELDRIRKSGELEKQYTDAMNKAKAAFGLKKYEDAKTNYQAALDAKPGDQPATDGIAKCDEELAKIAGNKEKEAAYQAAMTKANGLFGEKKFEQAKASYQEALNIKSGDKPATDGITKCDNAIAQMGMEEKYKALIAEADQFMSVKNFASAKTKYTDALGVKANDAYAKQKIAECDKELGFAIKDKKYISALAAADSLMRLASDETSYGSAKTAYKTASALKPMENYPKDKITEIDRKLADLKTEKARRAKYDGMITKANGLFDKKDYKGAKPVYEEALKLYPMELHPKQRLAEIDKLLNPTKVVTDPVVVKTREEIMNELVKKYPQGVTEILENDPSGNAKVTKRIVVKGNEAWVYTRKVHSWGGVYYFKDGVQISENTFNQETK